jgi:hypothetical protein
MATAEHVRAASQLQRFEEGTLSWQPEYDKGVLLLPF